MIIMAFVQILSLIAERMCTFVPYFGFQCSTWTCRNRYSNYMQYFLIAGAEAMFADLGHFSVRSIQVVYSQPHLNYPETASIKFFYGCILISFFFYANWNSQIAFTGVVFPCLLLAYMGQAAYLTKHPDSASRIFYDSVPGNTCSDLHAQCSAFCFFVLSTRRIWAFLACTYSFNIFMLVNQQTAFSGQFLW